MLDFNAWTISIFLICLAFSAFFSSTETAILSFQRLRLRHMASQGSISARRVEGMLLQPDKLLATILLGNNIVNVAAATIASAVVASLLGPTEAVLISTLSVTAILLVFGEVVPKTIGIQYAERVSLLNAPMLLLFERAFLPVVMLLRWTSMLFTRLLGAGNPPKYLISEEELHTLIVESRRAGVVDTSEAAMMHRVLEFGDRQVAEVMVPRPDVVWIEEGITLADFYAVFQKESHSRFPVFTREHDKVVGVLYTKDVVAALAAGKLAPDSVVTALARPAFFVPENKPIDQLFAEMRDRRTQVAVIVDEFGGVAGIVTLKQLVEEIMGPLGDEHFAEEQALIRIDERTAQVAGDMRIEDFNRELGAHLPEGRYETLAGFLLDRLGKVPRAGDSFPFGDLRLRIAKMAGVKIEKVLVTRAPTDEPKPPRAPS